MTGKDNMTKTIETEITAPTGTLVRRDFLKGTGVGLISSAALVSGLSSCHMAQQGTATGSRDKRVQRIASNSYAVNRLFKRRSRSSGQTPSELKKKYGEITMLDFPQFTCDTYAGVTAMDLWSSLFGDVEDDTQFVHQDVGGRYRRREFDPSTPSSRRYLDQLVAKMAATGVAAKHISNNAPRNLADLDEDKRQAGIQVAKVWLDACQQIGVV